MEGSVIFHFLCLLLWFWISDVTQGQNEDDNDLCRQAETCGEPVVTKISPTDGPPEGGTVVVIEGFNFGVQSNMTVTVAAVPCNNVTFMDRKINCTTSKKSFDFTEKSEESGQVVVTVGGKNSSDDIQFTYKMPKITSIYPRQGILSGGRTIYLRGTNLNIGNMDYEVELINVESSKSQVPVGCTLIKALSVRGNILCKPKRAMDTGMYKLKVTFDSNTEVESNLQFEYLPDPVIISTEPAELKSINSGGTTFNVIGEGFVAIDTLTVGIQDSREIDSQCRILTKKKLECRYPRKRESEMRRKKRATRSSIVIYLDGFSYTFPTTVIYVADPLFVAFYNNATYNFDPTVEETIKLVGKSLSTVTDKSDYQVLVGSGECSITSLTDTELVFRPLSKQPPPWSNEEKLFIRVKVGNMRQTIGIIEYSSQVSSTIVIIFVVSVLIIVALVVLVAVMIHRRNQVRKTRMIVNITKEMHDLKKDTTRIIQ